MTTHPGQPAAQDPASTTSTGLDPRVAAVLAYLLGWVSGLVMYLLEKEHLQVRFHAAQSVLLSIALLAVYVPLMLLGFVPVLGILAWLVSLAVALGGFVLWIYLLVQAYSLNHLRLPVIGGLAEQWAAR